MPHRLLATMLVFLLAGIPVPARSAGTLNLLAVSTVMQVSGAHFNAATVSAGATIYDGDGCPPMPTALSNSTVPRHWFIGLAPAG